MSIIVHRKFATDASVVGELTIDSLHEAWTLEPPFRTDKPRAIPAGTYDLTIRFSKRFARLMPHVENVPDFEGVLIHWGNFPRDTDACLLVGMTREKDFVGMSREEFDRLFLKLNDMIATADQTITYLDPPVNFAVDATIPLKA